MRFIKDESRTYCLNAIEKHINRKASLMITGNYGSGKTDLLKQIKNNSKIIRVRSLGSLYQLLGRIAGVKEARPHHKAKYLDYRCENPCIVIIDEAQDLPIDIYPYLKIIIDAGNVVILAGLPELHSILKNRHPDVLSRLTPIQLKPLTEADMFALVKDDFEEDAFAILYGSTEDMRVMTSCIQNCRDYLEANGLTKVDADIVEKFIDMED